MTELSPIDIAEAINMSKEQFSELTQKAKWYYFYLIHYGPNCDQIKYLLRK